MNETCGKKIQAENRSIDQVSQALANAVDELTADKNKLKRLGNNALSRAEDFTWAHLAKTIYKNTL